MSKSKFELNQAIEDFVKEKAISGGLYSREDLKYVNQFIGYGGMAKYGAQGKGLLSEYFTPMTIIEKMVGLAIKYGYSGGPICEPSAGVGRILHYFSPKTSVDAFEINEVAYLIAKANFPSFNIQHQYFNQLFVTRTGQRLTPKPKYQLVIGNPPYGNFTGKYSVEERKLTKATQYEDYFILRGLDLCVTGGLVVFVVPSRFLDSGEIVVKNSIAEKGELLDAYRLPKGVFDQTEVQTDIVVLKRI